MQRKDKFRVQYLRKLTEEKVWVPTEQRAPKHQSVIIFDWDDTLMWSSFLLQRLDAGRVLDITRLPPLTRRYLESIESATYNLLETASGLGHTFIITNAEEGWVEQCVERYMPSLRPILDKVRVISARTDHEAQARGDVGQWKKLAFLELSRQLDQHVITNLVSIGDSNFELEAVKLMGKQFVRSLVKTVKLQEHPSPHDLMKQLHLLIPKFRLIVEKATNMKACLERRGV